MLENTIWAQSLTPEQLARVTAEMIERTVPAGAFVCHKGSPVTHWIGVREGLLKMSSVCMSAKNSIRAAETTRIIP